MRGAFNPISFVSVIQFCSGKRPGFVTDEWTDNRRQFRLKGLMDAMSASAAGNGGFQFHLVYA